MELEMSRRKKTGQNIDKKNDLETNSMRKENYKVHELCSCRGFQGDSENALQNSLIYRLFATILR